MYLTTSEEMRNIDHHTTEKIGLSVLVLMENAGRALAEETLNLAHSLQSCDCHPHRKWLILVGKGNNGGDGLVAARHLQELGIAVDVMLAEQPEALSNDAKIQWNIAKQLDLTITPFVEGNTAWHQYDGIIDALLGTGTSGSPRSPYDVIIHEANNSGLPIVAADIPSGLDADTGAVYEPCIRAQVTVAFGFLKRGLLQYPGAEYAGKSLARAIGIPAELPGSLGVQTRVLTEKVLTSYLHVSPFATRQADTHKGTYGHVLIAAGTQKMSGAGILATRAALRTGCGLATWAMPSSLVRHMLGRLPEAMLVGMPDAGDGDWTHVSAESLFALTAGKDALAIGPGLGRYTDDSQWLRSIWESTTCPLLVDADALNMLAEAEDFSTWAKRKASTVLTPHPGEMARLCGLTTAEVQQDRIGIAQSYATRYGVTLVLKGAYTVIATPEGESYVNVTGNPGMATGGTGDVLSGIITSLLAQGLSATQAACTGVWLHGRAGDSAAAKRSTGKLLASDLVEELGQ
ncbi:MAG: NAD(P)H-hydrate dehydratase [Gorillibacterium sp.]|nr:NAD(P)H-hydrate dehydratase [Gorillibacterium sp.]